MYASIGLIPALWGRQWRQRGCGERRWSRGTMPRMHSKLPVRGLHTGIWTRGCIVRFKHVGA